MSGFDRNRVVGLSEADVADFSCGICHDILNQPVVTHCCRQSYCRQCIAEWLTRSNTCPNDRAKLNEDQLWPAPRMVVSMLSNIKVTCVNTDIGCDVILTMSQMEKHQAECPLSRCDACGHNTRNNHECVDTLKNKIIDLNRQVELLTKHIAKINVNGRTANDNLNGEQIILLARQNLDKYMILPSQAYDVSIPGVTRDEEKIIVDVCKQAINTNRTFSKMAQAISKSLAEKLGRSQGVWQVMAYSPDYGETQVTGEKYFRIEFDRIAIEIVLNVLKTFPLGLSAM